MSVNETKRGTFGSRVKASLKAEGWSGAQLARALGVAPTTITRDWCNAADPPDMDKAFEAALLLGYNKIWFTTGLGPMRSPETERAQPGRRRQSLPPDIADLLQRLEDALIRHFGRSVNRPRGDETALAKRASRHPDSGDGDKSG